MKLCDKARRKNFTSRKELRMKLNLMKKLIPIDRNLTIQDYVKSILENGDCAVQFPAILRKAWSQFQISSKLLINYLYKYVDYINRTKSLTYWKILLDYRRHRQRPFSRTGARNFDSWWWEKYTHESKIVKMVTTSKWKFIEHRGEHLNPADPLTLYSDSLSNEWCLH